MQKQSTFYAVVSIFFFWGFMAASNGIFIPFCKEHFQLTQFQSQLIDSTFYGGYFIGSLLLFLYTILKKKDFVNEHGYAKSFSIGLIISAVGALCMIPSLHFKGFGLILPSYFRHIIPSLYLHIGSYGLILSSFFIIALGFCLQQTAANPFVVLLGGERTGAHRLNLAGGVNSFGTTIGPLIVAYFLFGGISVANTVNTVELKNVDLLYGILIGMFVALAILLRSIKIEEKIQTEEQNFSLAALKYPQLVMGMIAIFVYVGVEVTIQSNMGALLNTPEYGSIPSNLIFPFISLYWGSLMIGRWTGASESLSENKNTRKILQAVLPFIAFAVVYVVNLLKAQGMENIHLNEVFLPYLGFVALMVVVSYFSIENSAKMLFAFSVAAAICMIGGMLTTGNLSLMFFLSGGLWCSVMWPCIFANAIKNLGDHTSQASSFLIMMILGGAVIPPFQGWLADVTDIKMSYIVTPLCFAYLAYYGWWALTNNQLNLALPKPLGKDAEEVKQNIQTNMETVKIFCPQCGTQNQKTFQYCNGCGFELPKVGFSGNGNNTVKEGNMTVSGSQILIVHAAKSKGIAILLVLLLGPLGLFYSTIRGGIIMTFVIPIIAVILTVTFPYFIAGLLVGFIFYWVICIIWAVIAVDNYNENLIKQAKKDSL